MDRSNKQGEIRLPSVMVPYRCRRTTLCCHPPWRVWVTQDEAEQIQTRLEEVDDKEGGWVEPDRAFEAAGAGCRLLTQPSGGCVFLGQDPVRCRLQEIGGLDLLPMLCRLFPRSVVVTPAGIEAAFRLACPTVSALVVEGAAAFTWSRISLREWAYPPTHRIDQVLWRPGEKRGFEELEELRCSWWAEMERALAASSIGSALSACLSAMIEEPESPRGRKPANWSLPSVPLQYGAALNTCGFLSILPNRGPRYQAAYPGLMDALQQGPTSGEVAALADQHADIFLCAAGLLLQQAGVHDARPALLAIRKAAQQVVETLSSASILWKVGQSTVCDAIQDALTVSALVRHHQQLSTLVFVD
ncbi:MAG: YkgJ family cysteine cluster protein [Bradymonadales bacterium]|nr:YkgJ family cysteine cluster protein [Bradymonadales bacterium]